MALNVSEFGFEKEVLKWVFVWVVWFCFFFFLLGFVFGFFLFVCWWFFFNSGPVKHMSAQVFGYS